MNAASPNSPSFASKHRLHNRFMYGQVFKNGRSIRGKHLRVRYWATRETEEFSRAGFLIRKKSGNAPFRNRVRRILRSVFQEFIPRTEKQPIWIIFEILPGAGQFSAKQLRHESQILLEKTLKAI